jgi:hypothetical protein
MHVSEQVLRGLPRLGRSKSSSHTAHVTVTIVRSRRHGRHIR